MRSAILLSIVLAGCSVPASESVSPLDDPLAPPAPGAWQGTQGAAWRLSLDEGAVIEIVGQTEAMLVHFQASDIRFRVIAGAAISTTSLVVLDRPLVDHRVEHDGAEAAVVIEALEPLPDVLLVVAAGGETPLVRVTFSDTRLLAGPTLVSRVRTIADLEWSTTVGLDARSGPASATLQETRARWSTVDATLLDVTTRGQVGVASLRVTGPAFEHDSLKSADGAPLLGADLSVYGSPGEWELAWAVGEAVLAGRAVFVVELALPAGAHFRPWT